MFADNEEADRLRAIDLGAGHSSSNETISGRVLAALKGQGLLNEKVGVGYIQRKWPPALAESGAWPLSGLRQSSLDRSLSLTALKGGLQRMIAQCARGRVAECRVIGVWPIMVCPRASLTESN